MQDKHCTKGSQDETDEEDEEEKIIYLTEPSEDRFEDEELAKKAKKEGQIARRHIYRAIPVLVISTLIAVFSAYLLTPLAKQKIIEFSGNKNADQTLLFEQKAPLLLREPFCMS